MFLKSTIRDPAKDLLGRVFCGLRRVSSLLNSNKASGGFLLDVMDDDIFRPDSSSQSRDNLRFIDDEHLVYVVSKFLVSNSTFTIYMTQQEIRVFNKCNVAMQRGNRLRRTDTVESDATLDIILSDNEQQFFIRAFRLLHTIRHQQNQWGDNTSRFTSIGIHSQQLQESLWWYQFFHYYRTLQAKDVHRRLADEIKAFCPRFPDGRDGTMIPGEKLPRVMSRLHYYTDGEDLCNVIVQNVEPGARTLLLLCTKCCHLGQPGIPCV